MTQKTNRKTKKNIDIFFSSQKCRNEWFKFKYAFMFIHNIIMIYVNNKQKMQYNCPELSQTWINATDQHNKFQLNAQILQTLQGKTTP